MNLLAFFTGLWYHVRAWFGAGHGIRMIVSETYLARARAFVYRKADPEVADWLSAAILDWLAGDAGVLPRIVARSTGIAFYKTKSFVMLAGQNGGAMESVLVERCPVVEIVAGREGLYLALYDGYLDGNRKTDSRFRIHNAGARLRYQFRYRGHSEAGAALPKFTATTHHDSEYSYYRDSPLATYYIEADSLPPALQSQLPQLK